MSNRNHMLVVPENPWARAEWIDEHRESLLRQVPYHMGLEGLRQLEATFFPKPMLMPLDPTCPECGQETEDGTVERVEDAFRVAYDCGHVLEFTEEELRARLNVDGRNA